MYRGIKYKYGTNAYRTRICICICVTDLGRHLQECSGARAGKCPTECFLSAFGRLARSAPKSAFRVFFGTFGAKKRPKALKKHSEPGAQKHSKKALRAKRPKALKKHSEPSAQKHSKNTPWGTFWPGPLSTPVNGGRDRKSVLQN